MFSWTFLEVFLNSHLAFEQSITQTTRKLFVFWMYILEDAVSIQLLYRNALDIHCKHTASQLHVAKHVLPWVLEWQWHQLDHMQTICTLLQTDNHMCTITQYLQAGCSSWWLTNNVKALKALYNVELNSTNTQLFRTCLMMQVLYMWHLVHKPHKQLDVCYTEMSQKYKWLEITCTWS